MASSARGFPSTEEPQWRSINHRSLLPHVTVTNQQPQTYVLEHVDWGSLRKKRYDREKEESRLLEAFWRCHSQAPGTSRSLEFVIITGDAGAGKTELATSLQPVIETKGEDSGLFVSGKFDQVESIQNYGPIIQAFTEFSYKIKDRGQNAVSVIQRDLADLAGTEMAHCLVDMIPALQFLLPSSLSSNLKNHVEETGKEIGDRASKRLFYALRSLVKAICSVRNPLILFLDDLQWADAASLELLTDLVSDNSIDGFMLIGACRNVGLDHPLSATLRKLENNAVAITNIDLLPLGVLAVGHIVDDVLGVHRSNTNQLADALYRKTGGNAFFVIQLLRSLADEGALLCVSGEIILNNEEQPLEANRDMTFSTDSFDCINAVDLLTDRIKRLPHEVQNLLMVASCFGTMFDESVVRIIVPSRVNESLVEAQKKGLVEKCGRGSWRFVHDLVHQSAYALVVANEKEAVHLQIGRRLWQAFDEHQLNTHVFLVANQLRIGAHLIDSQAERDRMASLLLQAGKKATTVSSFAAAASNFNLAIKILDQEHQWEYQYLLSLDLFNAAAEVEYYNANIARAEELVMVVLKNARNKNDSVRARSTYLLVLGSQDRLQAALDLGFSTLRDLGQKFSKKPSLVSVLMELSKTKKMLRKMSDEDILSLHKMRDADTFASMEIMVTLFTFCILSSQPLHATLVALRLVQLSLSGGMSSLSPVAFSKFSVLLCGPLGDVKLGVRMGKLSLCALESTQSKKWLARVYLGFYGGCALYSEPARQQLPYLLVAHQVGIGSGDTEFGLLSAVVFTSISICTSEALSGLLSRVVKFLEVAKAHGHRDTEDILRLYLHLAVNLSGRSLKLPVSERDATSSSYSGMESPDDDSFRVWNHAVKLMLHTYFQEFEEAAELDPTWKSSGIFDFFPCPVKAAFYLHEGLASLAMCDRYKTKKRITLARRNLRLLKALARLNPAAASNKAHLLEAELRAVVGNNGVMKLFRASIAAAQEHGLWNEAGLACERAVRYLEKAFGKSESTRQHINLAIDAYRKWGAIGKVNQLLLKNA